MGMILKKKRRRMKEVQKIRACMFLSWVFSIIIPIVLIIGINLMTHGSGAFEALTHPDYFSEQIYQLEELNDFEYITKTFENLTNEQPSQDAVNNLIARLSIGDTNEGKDEGIIIIRKADEIVNSLKYGPPITGALLEKFNQLPSDILPEFHPGRETNNELLFNETGYVITRQQDFYFDDGDEGSVFYLRKYTDIPGKIAATVGRNVLYLLLMMFGVHAVMAYVMAKKFTRPVDLMVIATEEVTAGNYNYRIPIAQPNLLAQLSSSLNDMIVELDKGKRYQERIESVRAEFIANMSHDMKTPLTSIKIHAQAINDGIVNTPEKMDKYIQNILKKSSDMESMLDELKVLNDLELGTGSYNMQQINFKHFLVDAVEELQYDVGSDTIELGVFTTVEKAVMTFDPMKIKRVINNITFNAVKYASIRPLKINFDLSENVDGNKTGIKFVISDNGVGVADEEYEKLFNQHYRVDPSRNQTISGSGLGLSIAKSIIEHHGGDIYAEKSNLGGLAIVICLNCEVS